MLVSTSNKATTPSKTIRNVVYSYAARCILFATHAQRRIRTSPALMNRARPSVESMSFGPVYNWENWWPYVKLHHHDIVVDLWKLFRGMYYFLFLEEKEVCISNTVSDCCNYRRGNRPLPPATVMTFLYQRIVPLSPVFSDNADEGWPLILRSPPQAWRILSTLLRLINCVCGC